ncbi:IS630 family transposase [Rhodanobacter umsongensis]|uniref:IS630 family transposase n=1 Tax=Rhodanobacter umsongensis TaxID=633153 RepID=A0ABW0JQN7_9GAMM
MRRRRPAAVLKLSKSERDELQQQAEARDGRADSARHARLILLLAEGLTWAEIRMQLHCSDSYIARWSKRFREERLAGLYARYAGRERYKVTDRLELRVLNRTRQRRPSDGSRHWSSRKLAAELGGAVSHTTVARIWSRHGITPHGLRHTAMPDAPAVATRAIDIIGVYLHRPQHAAIFRVEESAAPDENHAKPAARQREAAAREGVRALYAALKSGGDTFEAEPGKRQTSAEFAAFLAAVAAEQPADREIRVIADNPPASKTRALATLMTNHPNLRMQFMANHGAWLNQVEESLTEMERSGGSADDSKPAAHLEQKLMRYLRRRSQRARSLKWKHVETRKGDDRPGNGNQA